MNNGKVIWECSGMSNNVVAMNKQIVKSGFPRTTPWMKRNSNMNGDQYAKLVRPPTLYLTIHKLDKKYA